MTYYLDHVMSCDRHVTYDPQAYRSISKCLSAICMAVPEHTFPTVSKFIADITVRFSNKRPSRLKTCLLYYFQNDKSTDSVRLLCLLSVGEIGRKT